MNEPPPQPRTSKQPRPRPWSVARYLAGVAIPFAIYFLFGGFNYRDPQIALVVIGLVGGGTLIHAIVTWRWALFLGMLTTMIGAPLILFVYCVANFHV